MLVKDMVSRNGTRSRKFFDKIIGSMNISLKYNTGAPGGGGGGNGNGGGGGNSGGGSLLTIKRVICALIVLEIATVYNMIISGTMCMKHTMHSMVESNVFR